MVNFSLRGGIITGIFLSEIIPTVNYNLINVPRTLGLVTPCKLKGDPLFLKSSLSSTITWALVSETAKKC